MSTSDHLFLSTDLSPVEIAHQLVDALGGRVRTKDDGDALVLLPLAGSGEEIFGDISRSIYGPPPDPEPDEFSVFDDYSLVIEIWASSWQDDFRASRWLYDAVIGRFAWPVLWVRGLTLLLSAHAPDLGRTDFPPGTLVEAVHRDRWTRYAIEPGTRSPGPGAEPRRM